MNSELWGPVAFWGVIVIFIAGSLMTVFYGLGAAAAGSLRGGDVKPESALARIARFTFAMLDVLLAMASVVLLLVLSLVLVIGLLAGTARPLVVAWVPLLGTALSGGALVSAAFAQLTRKRHRWALQLAALALRTAAFLAFRLVDRVMR